MDRPGASPRCIAPRPPPITRWENEASGHRMAVTLAVTRKAENPKSAQLLRFRPLFGRGYRIGRPASRGLFRFRPLYAGPRRGDGPFPRREDRKAVAAGTAAAAAPRLRARRGG